MLGQEGLGTRLDVYCNALCSVLKSLQLCGYVWVCGVCVGVWGVCVCVCVCVWVWYICVFLVAQHTQSNIESKTLHHPKIPYSGSLNSR